MTHTPTPWETRELSNGDWAISQKGAPTAHTTVHTWNGKEGNATAQFIVTACNAHEELVAALKGLLYEPMAERTVDAAKKILHTIEKGG